MSAVHGAIDALELAVDRLTDDEASHLAAALELLAIDAVQAKAPHSVLVTLIAMARVVEAQGATFSDTFAALVLHLDP